MPGDHRLAAAHIVSSPYLAKTTKFDIEEDMRHRDISKRHSECCRQVYKGYQHIESWCGTGEQPQIKDPSKPVSLLMIS